MDKNSTLLIGLLSSLIFLISTSLLAEDGEFKGRVSKINRQSEFVRFLIRDKNIKFLSENDSVEFWSENRYDKRCAGKMVGKSSDAILVKVPKLELCLNKVDVSVGAELKLSSKELAKGLKVAQEVAEILVKKRLAIQALFTTEKKELTTYIDKVDAVNNRYEILMAKLQKEWQESLSSLEADRIDTLKRYKDYEDRMAEIDQKLEQYKIYDHKMTEDRWALDERTYRKKIVDIPYPVIDAEN